MKIIQVKIRNFRSYGDEFLKDCLCKYVTKETRIYQELEEIIFKDLQNGDKSK